MSCRVFKLHLSYTPHGPHKMTNSFFHLTLTIELSQHSSRLTNKSYIWVNSDHLPTSMHANTKIIGDVTWIHQKVRDVPTFCGTRQQNHWRVSYSQMYKKKIQEKTGCPIPNILRMYSGIKSWLDDGENHTHMQHIHLLDIHWYSI